MTSGRQVPEGFSEVFRDVMGHFASGVAVITARAGNRDFGTTASAITSLSMDPPMLLICLNRDSETHGAIDVSGRFTVNVLADGQEDIAARFAVKSQDKFGLVAISREDGGLPIVADALAHIVCEVASTTTGGTHTVFLGHALHAVRREGAPLAYFRGRFGRLEGFG